MTKACSRVLSKKISLRKEFIGISSNLPWVVLWKPKSELWKDSIVHWKALSTDRSTSTTYPTQRGWICFPKHYTVIITKTFTEKSVKHLQRQRMRTNRSSSIGKRDRLNKHKSGGTSKWTERLEVKDLTMRIRKTLFVKRRRSFTKKCTHSLNEQRVLRWM